MNRRCLGLTIVLGLCLVGTVQGANFVVTEAGPLDSYGYSFDAGNAVLFPKFAGPLYPADKISLSGTLTRVNPNSLASDSTWWLKASTGTGTAFSFYAQLTNVGAYTTMNITHNTYGLFWIGNYPQYRFEAMESYGIDDPGLDAQWTNMTFEFHSAVPVISTGWGTGTSVSVDTGGSSFGTELALYASDGTLLHFDNGSGAGGLTQLNLGSLNVGSYYLVAGGTGGSFQDLSALPGTESGHLSVNLDGQSLFAGELESERFQIINIEVVPEPSTLALLAIGGAALVASRLRRRPA